MPLKRKVYSLDDMPDWLAEACGAIPIVDFDDPSIDDLSAEEYGRLASSQQVLVRSPLDEPSVRAAYEVIPTSQRFCRMLGHKVSWESVGEFHSSPWHADTETIQASYETSNFLVEKRKSGKSADIDTTDCGILFNEKAKLASERAGFKDIIFQKVNAYYKGGEQADLDLYSAQFPSVSDAIDLDHSSLSWTRLQDGSGYICSRGVGGKVRINGSHLENFSFFWDVSIPNSLFVNRVFWDALCGDGIASEVKVV
ncbi:MAG: hypothetical protein JJ873_13360 [Maricaulis sp.]|uniref:imm11 family protein n=1 Tax=Maricaulis sp. TaxID=1486257 RepID=UPI001B1DAB4D|nr:DUF1629 domain-containing protein [Maricaulis sp.]MBO6696819.1 hypothetical protein [Henriciella sp.]MBO6878384.1 hypothetical protein [Maricaulis sp.]